jgi:hypothetical protein
MEPIVRTFPSGEYVNLLDMNPDQIHIEDIAHQLSLTNRFNGATRFPYSVAAHSIYMARHLVPRKDMLIALMHDAPEAYLGDLVKPLKENILLFKQIEDNLWKVISTKFNLPFELTEMVHWADKMALVIEKYHLRDEDFYLKRGMTEADVAAYPSIQNVSWQYHRNLFLRMFRNLSK